MDEKRTEESKRGAGLDTRRWFFLPHRDRLQSLGRHETSLFLSLSLSLFVLCNHPSAFPNKIHFNFASDTSSNEIDFGSRSRRGDEVECAGGEVGTDRERENEEERKIDAHISQPSTMKPIKKTEEEKNEKRTCALPVEPTPEREVGENAREGRREGHKRGCVDEHGDFFSDVEEKEKPRIGVEESVDAVLKVVFFFNFSHSHSFFSFAI